LNIAPLSTKISIIISLTLILSANAIAQNKTQFGISAALHNNAYFNRIAADYGSKEKLKGQPSYSFGTVARQNFDASPIAVFGKISYTKIRYKYTLDLTKAVIDPNDPLSPGNLNPLVEHLDDFIDIPLVL